MHSTPNRAFPSATARSAAVYFASAAAFGIERGASVARDSSASESGNGGVAAADCGELSANRGVPSARRAAGGRFGFGSSSASRSSKAVPARTSSGFGSSSGSSSGSLSGSLSGLSRASSACSRAASATSTARTASSLSAARTFPSYPIMRFVLLACSQLSSFFDARSVASRRETSAAATRRASGEAPEASARTSATLNSARRRSAVSSATSASPNLATPSRCRSAVAHATRKRRTVRSASMPAASGGLPQLIAARRGDAVGRCRREGAQATTAVQPDAASHAR